MDYDIFEYYFRRFRRYCYLIVATVVSTYTSAISIQSCLRILAAKIRLFNSRQVVTKYRVRSLISNFVFGRYYNRYRVKNINDRSKSARSCDRASAVIKPLIKDN